MIDRTTLGLLVVVVLVALAGCTGGGGSNSNAPGDNSSNFADDPTVELVDKYQAPDSGTVFVVHNRDTGQICHLFDNRWGNSGGAGISCDPISETAYEGRL